MPIENSRFAICKPSLLSLHANARLGLRNRLAEALKRHYVVVMVDVNKGHNADLCVRYGPPVGLPTIVILEDDGKKLTAENPEEWAKGQGSSVHYLSEKALAFLNEWAPNK